jgi:hypothetical protein
VELRSAAGVLQHLASLHLAERGAHDYVERFSSPVKAARLRIEVAATTSQAVRVAMGDMRVQGQTPALARYIRDTLTFATR